jgi:hypothetical protein
VVVDVSSSLSWENSAVLNFFETSTRNLLEYGVEAKVKHLVALSVVDSHEYDEGKGRNDNLLQRLGQWSESARETSKEHRTDAPGLAQESRSEPANSYDYIRLKVCCRLPYFLGRQLLNAGMRFPYYRPRSRIQPR